MSTDEARAVARDDCVRQSLIAGAKASAWALATSGLLVGLANQFLPTFRSSLGVSGKTALIVSPAFGFYFLQSELTMNECARKRRWVEGAGGKAQADDIIQKRSA